jgi:hypothetical protein
MTSLKKIAEKSPSAVHSGFDYFSLPPTQVSINRSYYKEILALSSSTESPHEFKIFSDSQFLDLNKVFLYLKVSIQKLTTDWVNIAATDECAPVQSFGTSFIKQLRLNINGNDVTDINQYHYLTYIKNELTYSADYKNTRLSAAGYYQDGLDQNSSTNPGHLKRLELAKEGRKFETLTRLDFDLANQGQFLLNNIDLTFSIYQNDDKFLVKSFKAGDTNNYRILVHSIKLYVRAIDVEPSLSISLMRKLENEPASYAMKKYQIRSYFLSSGRTEMSQNIFSNIVPKKVIVAFIDNTAYNGAINSAPYNFLPYNLKEITINAGGLQQPLIPYNANFSNAKDSTILRMFNEMHETFNRPETNGITLERYLSGSAFFVLQLSADDCDAFSLIREGTSSIRVLFDTPLKKAISMLILAEFDHIIAIDRHRIAISDNTV